MKNISVDNKPVDNKSEKYLIKYLKSLPDSQIKQFYNAVEWTPYPVLVIKEFQRRFDPNDDEFIIPPLDGDEYYEYTINNGIFFESSAIIIS